MELSRISVPREQGGRDGRHAELLRDKLSSALRLADQICGAPPPVHQGQPVKEQDIRALIKHRRNRANYFDADLFADPAWDMLLELYASHLAQQRISISSLCVGAAVPSTTALRWIAQLEAKGLIEKRPDPTDARRQFISLTIGGQETMADYFRTVPSGSPLI